MTAPGESTRYRAAVTEFIVDGGPLSPSQVVQVARRQARALPGPGLAEKMEPARAVVDATVASGEVVYGITTGFGALASTRIAPDEAETLQYNLIRSHASGVGPPLPDPLVRAILLLRARTLAQGHSGVRTVVVERLLEMLDRDILPVIPSQGSRRSRFTRARAATRSKHAPPVVFASSLHARGTATPASARARSDQLAALVAPRPFRR